MVKTSFLVAVRRPPKGSGQQPAKGETGRVAYSILIADDSALIRRYLRVWFEEKNWIVCGEAANGREAVEMCQQLKPDLIVMDLSMPVMNGLDAAREVKRVCPAVPLVMFTSFNTPNLISEATAAGFGAVVSKSDSARLVSNVQQLLPCAS